jgi:hypothetical protein
MKKLKFAEAVKDIYGFVTKEVEKKPDDDLPIQPFYLNKMMDSLAKAKIGGFTVSRPFDDFVQFGSVTGAIRARLAPNQDIVIERLTNDLRGRPLWITKKLFSIKTREFVGHEDSVASEIEEHIKELAREQIDSTQTEYRNLFDLTKKISQQVHTANSFFIFDEIKKVSENNYNIKMSVSGAGVGHIVATGHRPARQVPAGIIDMSFDPETGAIKGIVTSVNIEDEGSDWTIGVPYFMGQFSPTQSIDEISKIIISGLKFI